MKDIVEALATMEAPTYARMRGILTAAVIRRGLPPEFAPHGRWDQDAYMELTDEWLVQGGDGIRYLALASRSWEEFTATASSAAVRYVISSRQRTVLGNLYRRIRSTLNRNTAFRCLTPGRIASEQWWGLADAEGALNPYEDVADSNEQLVAAAFAFGPIKTVAYNAMAKNLPPVISGEDLTRFLLHVFRYVGHQLRIYHLLLALQYRMGLVETPLVSLNSAADDADDPLLEKVPAGDVDVAGEAERRVALDEILAVLSEAERHTLAAFAASDGTFSDTARRVGMSVPTVTRRLQRALVAVEECSGSADAAEAVFGELLARLMPTKNG